MSISETFLGELGLTKVQEAAGIAEYKLEANGLKILLAENHSKPVVTVMDLFHVGSRNEGVGYTGATHFLEHMMFKGTPTHNPQDGTGVMESIKPLGSMLNATTSIDRTNYFECVPSENLELCIELEADRVRNLRLRQEDRDSEMTVVRNEMERSENSVDSVMRTQLYATAFREHPYHHPTLGWKSDVEGVPLARFVQFYNDFYWPNNCTLMVVGDFDPANALTVIVKHFGKIPSSPHPIPTVYTVEPPQEGERRFEIRRAGDLPRVTIGFHVPEARHSDSYALTALAGVLGNSGKKTSRLYKRLIDSGLAVGCNAYATNSHDPGLFILNATVAPGAKIEDVEAAMLDELTKIISQPVTDGELTRAKTCNRKMTVLSGLDPMQRTAQIAQGEAIADWRWLMEFAGNVDAVTAKDIQRVAKSYFGKDNRTIGHFVPEEEQEQVQPNGDNAVAPKIEATSTFASQVTKRVLANGLTVNVMPNRGSGAVSVAGRVRAGDAFAGDVELVPTITSFLLTAGTTTRSQEDISETLEEMASQLNFVAERFDVSFATPVVAGDLPEFLALLSDMLRNPLFPAQELQRAKLQWQAIMSQQAQDTDILAKNKLSQALYTPGSPYFEKPFDVMIKELKGVTVEGIQAFHKAHYSPKSTVLTVVGDIDCEEAFALVESAFGDWQGPDKVQVESSEPREISGARRVEAKLADKKNTSILIGLPAPLNRSQADFCAARIANAALGGDTIVARLGVVVRVKNGLTYGITSQFEDTTFSGAPWVIELTVNPANIERALGLVKDVVDHYVKDGISDQELSDLVAQAANGFIVAQRSDLSVAGSLTRFESLGLGVEAMDRYAAELKSVTKDQVNAAIRNYFRLDQAVTAIAGTF